MKFQKIIPVFNFGRGDPYFLHRLGQAVTVKYFYLQFYTVLYLQFYTVNSDYKGEPESRVRLVTIIIYLKIIAIVLVELLILQCTNIAIIYCGQPNIAIIYFIQK